MRIMGEDDRGGGRGLRGVDKRQAALHDSPPRGPSRPQPEGLRRERTHPVDPNEGRGGDMPPHIPTSKPK